ncbi:MAG: hypothetical protein ACK5UX_10320 [Burkholderiales bacterium]|jgi:hypothetical protein|nr:hypothetical protein [Nitrosomonadaceae bacterium]
MSNRAKDEQRRTVAELAARIINDGETDYHLAKLKALKQLGLSPEHSALPDNNQIDEALRQHYALFSPVAQGEALRALRETALKVLEWLKPFEPWLCGPVLTGVANAHSEIDIELVGIEPKTFEMFLINAGLPFDVSDPFKTSRGSRALRYHLEFNDCPVAITLFSNHADRSSVTPRDSVRFDRAQKSEALRRFGFPAPPS